MENHKRFLEVKEKLINDVKERMPFIDKTIEFMINELMKSDIAERKY